MNEHQCVWVEDYYGYCCACGAFIPFGSEPWAYDDGEMDEDDPRSHSRTCTCEDCIQDHPERDILYGSGNNFDWAEE